MLQEIIGYFIFYWLIALAFSFSFIQNVIEQRISVSPELYKAVLDAYLKFLEIQPIVKVLMILLLAVTSLFTFPMIIIGFLKKKFQNNNNDDY